MCQLRLGVFHKGRPRQRGKGVRQMLILACKKAKICGHRGEGESKTVKFCGRLLWMASVCIYGVSLYFSDIFRISRLSVWYSAFLVCIFIVFFFWRCLYLKAVCFLVLLIIFCSMFVSFFSTSISAGVRLDKDKRCVDRDSVFVQGRVIMDELASSTSLLEVNSHIS